MTKSSPTRVRESQAIANFTRASQRLQLELAMNAARRHLDPLIELLEIYVEQTGGTLVTSELRKQLAEMKREVARRGNLRAVAN